MKQYLTSVVHGSQECGDANKISTGWTRRGPKKKTPEKERKKSVCIVVRFHFLLAVGLKNTKH